MSVKKTLIIKSVKTVFYNKNIREKALKQLDNYLYKRIVKKNSIKHYPDGAAEIMEKAPMALINSVIENVDKGYISPHVIDTLIGSLVTNAFLAKDNQKVIKAYEKKYGIKPPSLIVISPTQQCNLKCIGCYAASEIKKTSKIKWDYLMKVMKETHDEMGIRFYVISGGEPLLYEDEGHTIIDVAKMYQDSFFLMYTNGTLITKDVAKKMEEVGNITPAISVEGMKEETDARRGKGIYDQILAAMKNLREAGVPYGVSVTATRNNVNLLLKDDFYDYYFKELRANYMWMFQFMPIGRKPDVELSLTPEQRIALYKEWVKVLTEKNYFVADFWNSAILSVGCLSCARPAGYFYIDWDGKVMPCVFIPYYKDTIYELYDNGKKLTDALFSDFFTQGRNWVMKYNGKLDDDMGNLLTPCFIRDHHKDFYEIAKSTHAKPENEEAKESLESDEYHKSLIEFDEKLAKLADPIWNEIKQKKVSKKKK